MKAKCILFLTLCLTGLSSMAQGGADASSGASRQGVLFTPNWSYHRAGGDLDQRYYNFMGLGMDVEYKFKSNFSVGIAYHWLFGEDVKDSTLLHGIANDDGLIIDANGNFAVVNLQMRGHLLSAKVAYLYAFLPQLPNSGLYVSAGIGFMQHKIDILASQLTLPQLNGAYEAGYDRLTYGIATSQFIGYQYLVDHNRIHLRAGLAFNQGFTKGRRNWNYSTQTSGLDKRLDLTTAFTLGVIVPIYTKAAEEEEFFIN